MKVPDTLAERIEIFRANGQIFREEDELFTATSWAAVMMGQGIRMEGTSPMADGIAITAQKELNEMEKSIRWLVDHLPAHHEYLARYCPAELRA